MVAAGEARASESKPARSHVCCLFLSDSTSKREYCARLTACLSSWSMIGGIIAKGGLCRGFKWCWCCIDPRDCEESETPVEVVCCRYQEQQERADTHYIFKNDQNEDLDLLRILQRQLRDCWASSCSLRRKIVHHFHVFAHDVEVNKKHHAGHSNYSITLSSTIRRITILEIYNKKTKQLRPRTGALEPPRTGIFAECHGCRLAAALPLHHWCRRGDGGGTYMSLPEGEVRR